MNDSTHNIHVENKQEIVDNDRDEVILFDSDDYSDTLSTGHKWLLRMCIFVFLQAIYVATMHYYLPGGDSGELIAVACSWGVAHAPGYPLWTLLNAVFIKIANFVFGLAPAAGTALLSTIFGAFSGVCMYNAALHIFPKKPHASLVIVIIYGLSPSIWQHATIGEVFALHHLLTTAFLWFWLSKRYNAMALSAGLGLANQHTIVLFVVPIMLYTLYKLYKDGEFRTVPMMVVWGVVGLLPYIYIPIAAIYSNSWSKWGNPTSISGFLHLLLRRDYGTFQLASSDLGTHSLRWDRFMLFATNYIRETMGIGIFGAIGTVMYRRMSVIKALIAASAVYLLVFITRSNLPIHTDLMISVQRRFYPQAHIALLLIAVPAVGYVLYNVMNQRGRRIALGYFLILMIATQVVSNPPNRGGSKLVETYGRRVFDAVPPNAILLTKGDLNVNSVRYLQQCLGVREDVTIVDQETMSYEWFIENEGGSAGEEIKRRGRGLVFPAPLYDPYSPHGFSIAQFIHANKRPVYVSGGWKDGDETGEQYFALENYGLVSRARSMAEPIDVYEWVSRSRDVRDAVMKNLLVHFTDPRMRDNSPLMSKYEEWEWLVADEAYSHSFSWAFQALSHAISPQFLSQEYAGELAHEVLLEVKSVLGTLKDCVAVCNTTEEREAMAKKKVVPEYVVRNYMIAIVHLHSKAVKEGTWRCEMLAAIKDFLDVAPPDSKEAIMARKDYIRERRYARINRQECAVLKKSISI